MRVKLTHTLLLAGFALALAAWLFSTRGGPLQTHDTGGALTRALDTDTPRARATHGTTQADRSVRIDTTASATRPSVLAGRILDVDTRAAVPNAQVTLRFSESVDPSPISLTTDFEGGFSIPLTSPRSSLVDAHASALGYPIQTIKLPSELSDSMEWTVKGGFWHDIVVIDAATHLPIEAYGTLTHANDLEPPGTPIPEIQSHPLGQSTVSVCGEGLTRLIVAAPGYPIHESAIQRTYGARTLEIPRAVNVVVNVTRGGKPAASVPVSLLVADTGASHRSTGAMDESYYAVLGPVNIADSPFIRIGLGWGSATTPRAVSTALGDRSLRAPEEERQRPTNASGVATFSNLPPMTLVARAWNDAGQAFDSVPFTLEPGGHADVKVTIPIPGSVKGRVVGIARPEMAYLTLYDANAPEVSTGGETLSITVDGTFTVERILPGDYIAVLGFPNEANIPDPASMSNVRFTVRESETTTITLDASREPRGTIHLRLDVSGILPGELYFRWIRHLPQPSRWTNPVPIPADGNLELPFVRTGNVWYSIETAGHEVLRTAGPVRIDTDAIRSIRETLRIGVLRVRVVNPPESGYHGNLHIAFHGLHWTVDRVFDSEKDLTLPCAEGTATATVQFGSRLWKATAAVAGGVETLLELRESK